MVKVSVTHPCLIKGVVEIGLDCNGTVGVRVRERLPEERLPFQSAYAVGEKIKLHDHMNKGYSAFITVS